jgi:hypothetical protein
MSRPGSLPGQAIHLIVPSTAGGTTDIVGRALAQALSQRMNASFIVEQRVGGSTNIGMTYVAKAPPDGSTMFGLMIRMRRDEPRCGNRGPRVFRRLDGTMDIPEDAPPRQHQNGPRRPRPG